MSPPRLLFLVTEDWYFCSHRLPIARAALAAGYEVTVATRVDRHGDAIRAEGFRLIALPWRRRSRNPFREIAALARIYAIFRRERPDIVHNVAIKPVLYGSFAARLARVRRVVNALAGLGYSVAGGGRRAGLLRRAFRTAFRFLLNGEGYRVLVQNPDDADALVDGRVTGRDRVVVIRGSGVDIDRFMPHPEPDGPVRVAMVSRMVWYKGVREFVEAAGRLRDEGAGVDAILVGTPDDENPQAVDREVLARWHDDGVVEWRGHVDDVPALWAGVHIAVLPSHGGEGVPKSLLEAAASGRAIVATDVPGCREIVAHGENGLLVAPRDAQSLAASIRQLADDPDTRRRMGERGRVRAVEAFAENSVAEQTLSLYEELRR